MFFKYSFNTALILMSFFFVSPSFAEMVSISSQDINIRKGPGKTYDIIWKFGKGFPLQVLKKDGEWLNIEDFEGDQGWVHKSLTSKDPHVIVKANKGGKGEINVRKKPTTNSKVVAHAKYGVVLKTIEQKNGWAKVHHEEKNIKGWIKRSLLWGF